MVVLCWGAKGGVGTTVVAAALGILQAAKTNSPGVLLVDLAGDLPATLGIAEPDGPGISDWLNASGDLAIDALSRLEVAVSDTISLLPMGAELHGMPKRLDLLGLMLRADDRSVVIDAGVVSPTSAAMLLSPLVEESFLVSRTCYLALRAAVNAPIRPTGVVLLTEAGRALRSEDFVNALGVPVIAEAEIDPAVARAVDAGLLLGHVPRKFGRALQAAA